jgi:hypothetical protein
VCMSPVRTSENFLLTAVTPTSDPTKGLLFCTSKSIRQHRTDDLFISGKKMHIKAIDAVPVISLNSRINHHI